jgi:hypothetical protein
MIERETTWKLDFIVIGLWILWVIVMTSFRLPDWLNLTGVSWILIFGVSRWTWLQAAIFFLLIGWIFHSISLTPSGVFWLSGMIVFGFLKIAQLRLMIRNAFQFAGSVFLVSLFYFAVQLFFVLKIYPEHRFSWLLLSWAAASAGAQAILGFFIYAIFVKLTAKP